MKCGLAMNTAKFKHVQVMLPRSRPNRGRRKILWPPQISRHQPNHSRCNRPHAGPPVTRDCNNTRANKHVGNVATALSSMARSGRHMPHNATCISLHPRCLRHTFVQPRACTPQQSSEPKQLAILPCVAMLHTFGWRAGLNASLLRLALYDC